MATTIEMVMKCESRASEILDKIDGKKKNPDYYKNQKEARMLLILRDTLKALSSYTDENPLQGDENVWFEDIVAGVKRTTIEVHEGDNFLELTKKYINKPGAAIVKAIEEQGFKLDGMTVVKV